MGEGSTVLCILGAMIGAGFASGREIMEFFSQYGPCSVPLIFVAVMAMIVLMDRSMQGKGVFYASICGKKKKGMEIFLMVLLLCTSGGMIAAGGELWALVSHLEHARGIGMATTAAIGLFGCERNEKLLGFLGFLLIPLLLLALVLCMRLPALPMAVPEPDWKRLLVGAFSAFGYSGMNVALAAGVLRHDWEPCQSRKGCRCAVWSGCVIAGLLLLYNQVLLPHAAYLKETALPLVLLLRIYGKAGFYLSAAVLYLAVLTTLMAVLRGSVMIVKRFAVPLPSLLVWVTAMGIALMGFEKIVAVGYPVLGFICFLLIMWPKKAERASASSA